MFPFSLTTAKWHTETWPWNVDGVQQVGTCSGQHFGTKTSALKKLGNLGGVVVSSRTYQTVDLI
jgi:hypothetical protein